MEPKDSLPHSQNPYTGSCPDPEESSPLPHTLLEIHFNIIHLP